MNLLPLAAVIQYQAQLAIDRGVKVVFNFRTLTKMEAGEMRKILNG